MVLPNNQIYNCDLHIHSYYSDGRASPQEILSRAAEIGLKRIAITDHDNARGVREAAPLAEKFSIDLVPGIEFTTSWPASTARNGVRGNIDLLGYFFDVDDPAFQAFEQAALADIHERIGDCARLLTHAGYPVTIEDAFIENPRYAGVMQLVDAVWHLKKLVPDWDSALPLFHNAWQQVRLSRFSLPVAIQAIHAAGGAAILAHPTAVHTSKGWLQPEHLKALVGWGLDGLEIYHHRLDARARQYFLGLAQEYHLLVTGGSDDHGWPSGFPRLGSQPVSTEMVAALEARCN